MDPNLKKYALVKGNLYYTYGKTQLAMFFRLHFKTFFYLCGVLPPTKNDRHSNKKLKENLK